MVRERDFRSDFCLAFIEELEQGGDMFQCERDNNFVKNEYPYYSAQFYFNMTRLYRLWKKDSGKLLQTKVKLKQRVGREMAEKIKSDRSFRFFILKTLHDSTIKKLSYDEQSGVLTMKIDYDDAFCKIPFGKNLLFVFRGVKDFVSDIPDPDEAYLLISGDWYETEHDAVKLYFSGMDMNREYAGWELSFFYEAFEIMKGEEGDDRKGAL